MRDGRLQVLIPGEWELRCEDWWLCSEWMRRVYPSFSRLRKRLLVRMQEFFARRTWMATAIQAIVGGVLAGPPGAAGGQLALLRARLAAILRVATANEQELRLIVCVIAALDVQSRSADANPVVVGVRAAGWERVPDACAGLVVLLARTLRCWRDTLMRGRVDEVQDDSRVLDRAALKQARGELLRMASSYAHGPEEGWLDGVRAEDEEIHARTLAPTDAYYAAIVRVLDADDTAMLPLYEEYADACASAEARVVEGAAISLAQRRSAGEGDSLLRSALRAYVHGDRARCAAQAEAAFRRMLSTDAAGRGFAAMLVGWCQRDEQPLVARGWLMTAEALAQREPRWFRVGLTYVAGAVAGRLGDAAGAQRAEELRAQVDPDGEIGLPRWLLAPPRPPSVPGPHRDFDVREVRAALRGTLHARELAVAYRKFSDLMAGLLEVQAPPDAIAVLEACCVKFEEELRLVRIQDTRWSVRGELATLTSWTRGALADLCDAMDDHAGWSRHRLRQLELEDLDAAAKEPRDSAVRGWAPDGMHEEPDERRRYCLAEAQAALAAGEERKAGFWAARARHYGKLVTTEE